MRRLEMGRRALSRLAARGESHPGCERACRPICCVAANRGPSVRNASSRLLPSGPTCSFSLPKLFRHRLLGVSADAAKRACVALVAVASTGSDAFGTILGLGSEYGVLNREGQVFHVLDVYVEFSSGVDRVLLPWNTVITLNAKPGATFYHAPPEASATCRPLCASPWSDLWDADSFVAIGGEQCDMSGSWFATPDLDVENFLLQGSENTPGGWFNIPPTSGANTAGPDHRVRIARLSLEHDDWAPGSTIEVAWSVGWVPGGGPAQFAEVSATFALPSAGPDEMPLDIPGEGSGGGAGLPIGPPLPAGPAGSSDLVWISPGGYLTGWNVTALTLDSGSSLADPIPPLFGPAGSGDADGDGDRDFFLLNLYSHELLLERMEDGAIVSEESLGTAGAPWPTKWHVLGITDVSGDGQVDVVWRREDGGSEQVRVWILDDGDVVENEVVGISPGFEFLCMGDFNGDGKGDILWRILNGYLIVWPLNGSLPSIPMMFGGTGAIPQTWSVGASCDLDADGDDDIVWRKASSGQVNGWIVEGCGREFGDVIATSVGPKWQLQMSADLDSDGTHDLLWRHTTTGQVKGWLMDELVKAKAGEIGTLGSGDWQPW